ncbi:hypothetical protein SNS2_0562 [Streptomyces netropsis]|uniref:Uncharacterized protein n=1 Tax=Streptomyces syringium TaxID=76729 RepID=A0ABS4XZN5_9ACTN|nr:hypothetical protein [Streptomyces syringium]MBP2401979.1 hypothetical protein [Streptomyces syringium]SPE48468.1 hypothetical protein SNS2_0562 [Streptomyces netropsis]
MIIRRVFATVLARIVPCDTPAASAVGPRQNTTKSARLLLASGAANKEMQ